MRIEGTLSKWNDDRGFGFITPTLGGQEIFVHISTFPKDGVRPTLGEKLTFEIETDSNGKKRAKNLACPERRTVSRTSPAPSRTHCSQMTSCAEATFFLRNCPNVQMDGNNDGVPCEQQWCTSPFAR